MYHILWNADIVLHVMGDEPLSRKGPTEATHGNGVLKHAVAIMLKSGIAPAQDRRAFASAMRLAFRGAAAAVTINQEVGIR